MRFLAAYRGDYDKEVERRGVLPVVGPTPSEKASLDRVAISKALMQCGYLLIRRRRVAPPIRCKKAAIIR